MQPDLKASLGILCRTPLLLVACDYDGTLAGFALDPASAQPDERAMHALRRIDALPGTTAAIVSGRSVHALRSLLGSAPPATVVGSHGAEWKEPGAKLTADQRRLLEDLAGTVREIAGGVPGIRLELKPAGVALHVRGAAPQAAADAIASAVHRCGSLDGVHTRHGSQVVEFMVLNTNKGRAVHQLRHATAATGVLFIGDDLTDEDAFRVLSGDDVAVKVGRGDTAARFRVGDISQVADLLGFVADRRADWAGATDAVRLDRCAVLSDQRTAAVVSPGADITWLCLPRLDSSAIFAGLLGDRTAGHFSISPVHLAPPSRTQYAGDSLVLVTEWPGLRVTDYLDCSAGRPFHKAGRTDLIRVVEAAAPAHVRFAPRLDYGRIATQLRLRDGGIEVQGSNDPITLRSAGVRWTITREGVHDTAEAVIEPGGAPVVFELRYGSASLTDASATEQARRDQTLRFWAGWARSLTLPSRAPDMVRRSALVLKSLFYGPTGAPAAAATTSLPEQLGGVRNWDYRYCWPRDAAMTAASLVRLGNTGHAMKFLDWVLEVVDRCESPERLHPIYTVSGAHLPPEAELGHLGGFAHSRPVRIGNAAANQVQLDVFGPIVNLVAMLAERGAPIAPDHWRLVRAMVRAVEARWTEPDHGIWEMRLERRHHVHSKVMCWHTVDRAIVVEQAVAGTRDASWLALRDAIRDDVLTNGWNAGVGSFTGAFGHDYADAAVLKLGTTGLIEPGDPRWAATVDRIIRDLADGPTVRRYLADDGLPGTEGGMHICTAWLIEALITLGRIGEADALFRRFTGLVADPGILTEQFDPRHGTALGNLAQAYSHLALIDAAVALDRAGA
ncbi:MAG: trehalose-phosphatase [Phycisphaerales bacterium]|nr:trehalose-phosphatase [Phycisphaerales bacterium]